VLAQLDKDAAILFEDFECSLGTSLVAGLEQSAALFGVVYRFALVERRSVAVGVSVWLETGTIFPIAPQ